jgi:hypothetical protein
MLVSWLQTRYPGVERKLPISFYSTTLFVIASGSYWFLGWPPRFTPLLWPTLLTGLTLGGIAVSVDLSIVLALRRIFVKRERKHTYQKPQVAETPPYSDVPTDNEVIWRLHEHGMPWRSRLSDLLLIAALEECIYRQALIGLLVPISVGSLLPALISTLGFGLIHVYFGFGSVISKWIIGGIFMAAVLAGAGLVSVMLAHCVLNTAAYLVTIRSAKPAEYRPC